MVLPIFPMSPLPADLDRWKDWASDVNKFDSGAAQGATSYVKPLYQYSFAVPAMNEIKQSSLWAFVDTVKQTTNPFLIKDPYDFRINSVLAVRSGLTNGSSLFLYDTNSYMVRADTVTIGSLFSALSGYVLLGTNFTYDQDTGIITLTTKSNTDVWGVRSTQYWKKVRFGSPWKEKAIIWNIFGVPNVIMSEEP